jgi:CheY-like chemotaxis protein
MPEMDGLALLEHLKHDPQTADIPVVVVSAKTLTPRDRQVLDALSDSVWSKGGFDTRALVDHVVRTLGHNPTDSQAPTSRPVAAVHSHTPEPAPSSGLPLVVIIDDNPHDLRLMRRYLEATQAFRVIDTETGRDGLKAIYKYHPEVVVLDLMLPDMDGFEVLDTLRRDPVVCDIPVVITSARELTEAEMRQLDAQTHALLSKSSLDRQRFVMIIKDVLI